MIDKFAGYGFNKSHAAAYALLAYQTGWLKAHYPADFFAASMAFDISNTDKLSIFVDDAAVGIALLAPCINRSEADFTTESAEDGVAVRFALGGLKGVGEAAMAQLCAERKANGPFTSLDDFADRINPRLLNRRQLENLASADAFDASNSTAQMIMRPQKRCWLLRLRRNQRGRAVRAACLAGHKVAAIQIAADVHWSTAERMAQEKESFGFYFSAHPVDRYRHLAESHGARTYAVICGMPVSADGAHRRVDGGVTGRREWRTSARGNRYANCMVSDPSGQFIASCFDEDVARQVEEAAKSGSCLFLSVELDRQSGEERRACHYPPDSASGRDGGQQAG